MENTTIEYFPVNTTTTSTTELAGTSLVFIIMFGGFFGFILLFCICHLFMDCISPNPRNTSCYSTTCSILCLISMDIMGLCFCNYPILNSYHNEEGTGKCDEYDCKYCRCCCSKKSIPTLEIEQLFEIVVTQPSDKQETCVICCEELGKGKHGELKCGHKFHKKCIKQWMEVSAHKNCPTCRDSQIN